MNTNLLMKIARIISPSGDDFLRAREFMRTLWTLPMGEYVEIGRILVVLHNEDDTWTVADNGDSQEARDYFEMETLLESFIDKAIEAAEAAQE